MKKRVWFTPLISALLGLFLVLWGCGDTSVLTAFKNAENTPSTYNVTYNGNSNTSGSVPTNSNNYIQGATVTVLGNTGNLVRSGYTFAGWNTASDGSGTTYKPWQTFTMGNANVTLYAMWGGTLEGGSIQGHALVLSGVVTTLATGMSNPCFATTDGTYVYNTAEASNTIYKMDLSGNNPTLASVPDDQGIVTDGTYLYVTSYSSGKVEKVNASTGAWSDLTTALSGPCGITLDGGYLYVACNGGGSSKVYKIDKASGASALFASGLSNIAGGITTDGSYLYVTESAPSSAVQRVDFSGNVTTLAIGFNGPWGITSDGTYLYVADVGSNTVYKVDASGTKTVISTSISGPAGITTDGTYLYVSTSGGAAERIQ